MSRSPNPHSTQPPSPAAPTPAGAPAGTPTPALTPEQAQAFADRWFAAWNTHDLDAIMACYEPTIEHSSPFIKRYNAGMPDENDTALRGTDRVRDYFRRALERNPTLRFDPMHITTGLESVLLVYRRMNGDLAGEVFFLSPRGLIQRSVSHYG